MNLTAQDSIANETGADGDCARGAAGFWRNDDGQLMVEGVALAEIASTVDTPAYVYSRATLEASYRAWDEALAPHPHRIAFAVKANSALGVLDVLGRLGAAFDIVSRGELERVLRAGGHARDVVFSGVGKRDDEIDRAIALGIKAFNVESAEELDRIAARARALNQTAPISIRVNPEVDANTHPYIATGLKENKFGVAFDEAVMLYRRAHVSAMLDVVGIDAHIGSQITSLSPFVASAEKILGLVDALGAEGIALDHIDLGGGLGITYRDETPPTPADWGRAVLPLLEGRRQTLLVEPGRSIAAPAGVLLVRVLGRKTNGDHHFVIVDGAMNDLMRPALYGAWQAIESVAKPDTTDNGACVPVTVVGPVCETGDFLGKQRTIDAITGDLLVVRDAGAYGFTMASRYNSRPKPAEVLVSGAHYSVITRRETIDDLMSREARMPSSW
ncbi:MAG: diaminopimelate decarboxylase [Thioalkalivibrionaceae bacterium]